MGRDRYVALVTGGRVRIGYEIVLKLLRAGAHVLATTRFPADAAARFADEVCIGATDGLWKGMQAWAAWRRLLWDVDECVLASHSVLHRISQF